MGFKVRGWWSWGEGLRTVQQWGRRGGADTGCLVMGRGALGLGSPAQVCIPTCTILKHHHHPSPPSAHTYLGGGHPQVQGCAACGLRAGPGGVPASP